ncbi:MAG: hypothetical protein WEB30_01725 [Cyclobacteriaceae bacterium]
MQIRAVLGILTLLLISIPGAAQRDSVASKPSYFFSLHSGALVGKKEFGTSFTWSLIQGVRHKRFAFGIGIGYDTYSDDWRAMPLFASFTYDYLRIRTNSLYIQLNAGKSKIWNPMLRENEFLYYEHGNIFLNPLLAYRMIGDKFNLYLSAGYKFQMIEYGWSWGGNGGKTYVGQDTERMVIQMGFGFH